MAAKVGNANMLGAALFITLGLVWWVSQEDGGEDTILLANPGRNASRPSQGTPGNANQPKATVMTAPGLQWELLQSRTSASGQPVMDLFKSHAWYVPPPKAAEPPPPPPRPVAPMAPFSYVGKLEDGPNGTVLMLAAGARLYTVAIGDVLDGQWRLDQESADSLKFTYLPLGLPQTLLKSSRAGGNQANDLRKTQNQGTES